MVWLEPYFVHQELGRLKQEHPEYLSAPGQQQRNIPKPTGRFEGEAGQAVLT